MTVYYRWHPLFGQCLPVHKRRRNNNNEQVVFCRLSDGRLCSVPDWMLSPECGQFSFGPPMVSVDALCQLHSLLTTCQVRSTWGNALLESPIKEGGNETTGEVIPAAADESAASRRTRDRSARPQAKGTGTHIDRDTNQRGPQERDYFKPPRRKT
jgi:hypothetical protein